MAVKRRVAHATFACLVLLSASATLYEAWQLVQVRHVNRAIATMAANVRNGLDKALPSDPPEVILARGITLAASNNTDAAAKTYSELIVKNRLDASGRAALFNLGNLYLRQGARRAADGSTASLPMVELAKQRYRDLLKLEPDDWDARFNLERALRIAPEMPTVYDDSDNEPVDRRKMMAPELAAPELP
jgi:mxaK protein